MSFADVAARLHQVAELAGQALQALHQASDTAADSTTLITESMAGTSQESEAAEVTANFHAVHTGALDLSEALTVLLRRVEEIRSRFEVGAAAPSSAPEPTWADQQRSRLPTYITSGYYLDPDGYIELVQSGSEPDGEHQRIHDHLVETGAISPFGFAEAAKHVEMKVAWRMRRGGVDRVDVTVNNRLCEGVMSCTELLPDVLLPGQTLIIHDPVSSFEIRGRDVR